MEKNEIHIFTDGSSRGNPGPGGWGAIITNIKRVLEIGGGESDTTNNRMELTAIIRALQVVKVTNKKITVYTDSQYAINGITKWVKNWQANGWVTKAKKDVSNKDLWEEFIDVTEPLCVSFKHVEGHVGIVGNERSDTIATAFASETDIILFDGLVENYRLDLSKTTASQSKKKKKKRKAEKAFSYLSYVNGEVKRHETWIGCESAVKGKKKVKYRKTLSLEDEKKIIQEWRE